MIGFINIQKLITYLCDERRRLVLKGRFLLISRPKNLLAKINIEFPVEIGDLGSCGA